MILILEYNRFFESLHKRIHTHYIPTVTNVTEERTFQQGIIVGGGWTSAVPRLVHVPCDGGAVAAHHQQGGLGGGGLAGPIGVHVPVQEHPVGAAGSAAVGCGYAVLGNISYRNNQKRSRAGW